MAAPFSYKNDEDADYRGDPYNPENLRDAEQRRYNREFDDIANNFDQDADDSQENANIQNARDREQAGNGIKVDLSSIKERFGAAKNGIKAKFNIKKAMPAGTMVAIVFGAGGAMTFIPLGIPLLSVEANITNAHADASRAQSVRYRSVLRYMVGNDKVEAACNKNPTSVLCRLGTMSDKSKQQYEANKFKINGKQVGDRWLVKSMTSDKGETLDSADKIFKKMRTDAGFSRSILRSHNAGNNVFNGGNFSNKILSAMGLNKSLLPDIPDKKDDRNKVINKLVGLEEDGKASKEQVDERIRTKAGDEGIKKTKLAKALAAIPSAACMVYNGAKVTLAAAKMERYLYYAKFAFPFIKAASQIRLQGQISPGTVTALSDQLTTPSTADDDTKDKNALDSQGMKLVFGGDETGLQEYTKSALLGDVTTLIALNNIINRVDSVIATKVPGGAKSTRSFCRLANSMAGQVIGTAACFVVAGVQAGAGAAAGTVVPLLGNLVGGAAGGILGAAECAAAVVGSFIVGEAASLVLEKMVIPWATRAAIAGLPNATSAGPVVGDAIVIGATTILNRTNRSNGLIPVKKDSGIKLLGANADVKEEEARQRDLEIADAKSTPFDVYNRYSFLGSIVAGMNDQVFTSNSRMHSGNFAFQRLFSTFSLTPSVLAAGESQSSITMADLSKANCAQELATIGGDCDIVGQESYTMSDAALTMGVEANYNWMKGTNNIDESGQPVPDSEYAKASTYCFDRVNAMGLTTEPIESDDYDWASGERCYDAYKKDPINTQKWDNFQAWRSIMINNQDADYTEGTGGSGNTTGVGVMSYNVLGDSHKNNGGFSPTKRANDAIQTIKAAQPDIIGFQEMSGKTKRIRFHDGLKDTYDVYPYLKDGQDDGVARPIYWNKTKYTAVEKGTFTMKRYKDNEARFPYVKLKDNATSTEFYVLNLHTSANSFKTPGYTSPEARAMQTKKMIEFIQDKVAKDGDPNIPVITTGDYNSTCEKTGHDKSISKSEIPCVLLQNAGFSDAGVEAYKGSKSGAMVALGPANGGNVPVSVKNYEYSTSHGSAGAKRKQKKTEGRHIDHVFYTTQNTKVVSWENIITPETKDASDHTPVIARLMMNAKEPDDGSVSSADFSYPFGEDAYKKNAAGYLRAHTARNSAGEPSGTSWEGVSGAPSNKGAGIAVDLGAAAGVSGGKPVKAMFGGEVVSIDLCRDAPKDGIAIKSNVSGGTLLIAYMHGTNKRFKVGDKVKAGDTIMDVGEIGCSVFGPHLHLGIAFNGKYICPQDIFVGGGKNLNFSELVKKGKPSCGGRSAKIL